MAIDDDPRPKNSHNIYLIRYQLPIMLPLKNLLVLELRLVPSVHILFLVYRHWGNGRIVVESKFTKSKVIRYCTRHLHEKSRHWKSSFYRSGRNVNKRVYYYHDLTQNSADMRTRFLRRCLALGENYWRACLFPSPSCLCSLNLIFYDLVIFSLSCGLPLSTLFCLGGFEGSDRARQSSCG